MCFRPPEAWILQCFVRRENKRFPSSGAFWLLNQWLQKAGHLAFTAGPRAIPNTRQAVCKVPEESLTVICVQVEQILKLIKLQPHDENAKTNLAFGSGRIKNRWLTIFQGLSRIANTWWGRNAKSVTINRYAAAEQQRSEVINRK